MNFNKSRIYTFIDQTKKFSINFFDAQKFLNDALKIQSLPPDSLDFFRDSLLSYPTLVAFTKPGEEFGLYLDSDNPYFRFKFESFHNNARTLFWPENVTSYPSHISGLCRLQKFSPYGRNPYTSVISLKNDSSETIFKKIFEQSYQLDAILHVSPLKTQSIMIYKIPPEGGINQPTGNPTEQNETLTFFNRHQLFFQEVFEQELSTVEEVVEKLETQNFEYLSSRVIEFFCQCTRDNFITKLCSFSPLEREELFNAKDEIEVKCDYCKKMYLITKQDFVEPLKN